LEGANGGVRMRGWMGKGGFGGSLLPSVIDSKS